MYLAKYYEKEEKYVKAIYWYNKYANEFDNTFEGKFEFETNGPKNYSK